MAGAFGRNDPARRTESRIVACVVEAPVPPGSTPLRCYVCRGAGVLFLAHTVPDADESETGATPSQLLSRDAATREVADSSLVPVSLWRASRGTAAEGDRRLTQLLQRAAMLCCDLCMHPLLGEFPVAADTGMLRPPQDVPSGLDDLFGLAFGVEKFDIVRTTLAAHRKEVWFVYLGFGFVFRLSTHDDDTSYPGRWTPGPDGTGVRVASHTRTRAPEARAPSARCVVAPLVLEPFDLLSPTGQTRPPVHFCRLRPSDMDPDVTARLARMNEILSKGPNDHHPLTSRTLALQILCGRSRARSLAAAAVDDFELVIEWV